MLRGYFVLIGGLLTGCFLLAALMATTAAAGHEPGPVELHRSEEPRCRRGCTRVMDSGRLPREQMYIGYFNRGTRLPARRRFRQGCCRFHQGAGAETRLRSRL